MWVQRLQVGNFRNLVDDPIDFDEGMNWLTGDNGQGKTNCLEMVYFALTSKSFRTPHYADLVRDPAQPAEVWVRLRKDRVHQRLGVVIDGGKSRRFMGDNVCKPLEFIKLSSVIAFTSRSKNLVEGVPEDRRRFLDRMVSHLDPEHMVLLGKYRRIQNQLRKVLLGSRDLGVYRGFKATLVEPAWRIVQKRLALLEEVRAATSSIYGEVFAGTEPLSFQYQMRNCRNPDGYRRKMEDVCAQEVLHGRSLLGPHLDDLKIGYEHGKARNYASSGQVRAIVLSLKLAVRELYRQRFGELPILLLDDIDAELDPGRLEGLLDYLQGRGQALISTSKYGTIKSYWKGRVYEVVAGRISSKRNHA